MVEMLGVLAVIGVLSVAGIAGFKNAMDKNKANMIINEAQKRATLVVPQIQLMGNENPTITEFINNDLGYGEFDAKVYTNKADNLPAGQFGIKVSGVNKSICQNILNTIGENTVIRRLSTTDAPTTPITTCGDDNTFLMVYNNDMSSNVVAGEFGYDDCPESFYPCPTTHSCVATENECPIPSCSNYAETGIADDTTYDGGFAGKATDGITDCKCETNKVYTKDGCVEQPSSCTSYTTNVCGLGYYCKPSGSISKSSGGTGQCTPISDLPSDEWKEHIFATEKSSWWAGMSWCIGHGSSGLISKTSLSAICDNTTPDAGSVWTSTMYSCSNIATGCSEITDSGCGWYGSGIEYGSRTIICE